nr:aldehyde dehydrogenase [Saprospiraceae bacterium]
MDNFGYERVIEKQKEKFYSGEIRDLAFRKAQLKKLKAALQSHEGELYQALQKDFGKSEFETFATELAVLSLDISDALKNLKKWSRKKRVGTNLINFPSRGYLVPEPLGTALIIGAWNYPIQLTLAPLIPCMAAGNTAVIKPSEITTHTSAVIAKMIGDHFPEDYLKVIEGGVEETTALLKMDFNKIFFTGSTRVGKIIYEAAAKKLIPVTLELGGKSPAIVAPDSNLDSCAKRIVWGKFLNSGQTCIAPDYILVHQSVRDELIEKIREYISAFDYRPENDNYVKIVNDQNFGRLIQLIEKDKVVIGGNWNREKRFIEPTVMVDVKLSDPVMQEEIFGPILPVITFEKTDDIIDTVRQFPNPLALYLFTGNKKVRDRILSELSFGGGAINDTIMHITHSKLPFGGTGQSGMGKYHGEAGFRTFSHLKSILDRGFWPEPPVKYPPYSSFKLKLLKWVSGWR